MSLVGKPTGDALLVVIAQLKWWHMRRKEAVPILHHPRGKLTANGSIPVNGTICSCSSRRFS